MASWIAGPIAERLPGAVRCVDPFHVVALATDALDEVRREVWNEARRAGQTQLARDLKGARFALWKNPERLTDRQQTKLSMIQQTNEPLYRAYLLKEQLHQIYRLPAEAATALLERWLKWARRCRLKPFVKLARTITDQRAGIVAAIEHGLSNAPGGSDQHPDPPDHPPRLRLSLRRRPDRPSDAHPRRPLPPTSTMTHPRKRQETQKKGPCGPGNCSEPCARLIPRPPTPWSCSSRRHRP